MNFDQGMGPCQCFSLKFCDMTNKDDPKCIMSLFEGLTHFWMILKMLMP